jgi:hypothetical protein
VAVQARDTCLPSAVITASGAGCDNLQCVWMLVNAQSPVSSEVEVLDLAQTEVLDRVSAWKGNGNFSTPGLVTFRLAPELQPRFKNEGLFFRLVNKSVRGLCPSTSPAVRVQSPNLQW